MSKKDYSSKSQEQNNKVEITAEPKNDEKEQSTIAQKKSVKHIAAATAAKVAILTALAWIFYMYVKVKLPFIFPEFLEMQISDLPALLGGFALGPLWGCVIVVLKCLLKMPFSGTACVGELADIFVGVAFVLPASLVYKKHKTKKGAFLGLLIGMAAAVVVSLLANRFVLVPFYVKAFFGGSFAPLLNMVSPLYPKVTESTFYLWYLGLGVLPFNIIRCALSGGLTFALYKSLSRLLHI